MTTKAKDPYRFHARPSNCPDGPCTICGAPAAGTIQTGIYHRAVAPEENIPFRFLIHTPGAALDLRIKGICATEDLRNLAPPDVPSNEGLTVLDYVQTTYKADHFDIDPLTLLQYAATARRLDEWHGKPFLMQDLSTETVSAWMAWLLNVKKFSPVTVNSKRRGLLTLWADASWKGLAPPFPDQRNPREKIRKLREPQRTPVTWTMDELTRLLNEVDKIEGKWQSAPIRLCWRVAFLFLWDSGARLRELREASTAHVNIEAGTWTVPAENRKGRRKDKLYHLHAETIEVYKATHPATRKKVFPFPYVPRQLQVYLSNILKHAGLPSDAKHKFHCFRRTAESQAAAAKGIQWAADAVGHNVAVARKSYVSEVIAPGPKLIDAIPRIQTAWSEAPPAPSMVATRPATNGTNGRKTHPAILPAARPAPPPIGPADLLIDEFASLEDEIVGA